MTTKRTQCKAITATGYRCSRQANQEDGTGYCTQHGYSPTMTHEAARKVLDAAHADLGPDLGRSVTDLLADNFPSTPLDECRAMAKQLHREKGQAGRLYFFRRKSTGDFIAVEHGTRGYFNTTVYDWGHATVLNAHEGNSMAEIQAAEACSIFGNWTRFWQLVDNFQTAGNFATFWKGQAVVIAVAKTDSCLPGFITRISRGLATVEAENGDFFGIFSTLDGAGLYAREGMTMQPSPEAAA